MARARSPRQKTSRRSGPVPRSDASPSRRHPPGHLIEGPGRLLIERRAEIEQALRGRDLTPRLFFQDSGARIPLDDGSVQLVVTSPPYPYIERWDAAFESALGLPGGSLGQEAGHLAAVHDELARTWRECHRLLQPGGILAVNIGDATRSVGGEFRLLPNHAHVVLACERLGFRSLVPILWKKPTNRPDSFLGSGFAPPNAYVTMDCEHILLFRKGGRRVLPPHDPLRAASQFSKAERDRWFSQIWTLRGAPQGDGRSSFPEEVPFRLVRMYSLLGDTVLDPFAGSGTTVDVARRLGRRAIGVERDASLEPELRRRIPSTPRGISEVLDELVVRYGKG